MSIFFKPEERDKTIFPHDVFKSLVVPRPIGWISSISKKGETNLAPYSFFSGCYSYPNIVSFCPEGNKDSKNFVLETQEFVFNLVSKNLIGQMNISSEGLPKGSSEFETTKLTPIDSVVIKAPRVKEAFASLECKVTQSLNLKDMTGNKLDGCVIFGQVVGVHLNSDVIKKDGKVDLKKINDGLECIIEANLVLEDLKTNDSISCSGICLTATKVNENSFKVQLVNETLERTTAKHWKESSVLNLERALLPSTRLGGHLVQGHVDTVTTIKNIQRLDESAIFTFEIDAVNRKYIVEKGSVCLDGISLTVASISETQFTIALIPHTLGVTSWENSRVGDQVNLEVDIMAKYIENMMSKK